MTVIGEAQTLVPVKIRKVIYVAQNKPDPRSEFLQFAGQSEGWEVVEAHAVRRSSAEIYAQMHPPVVVGEKEVRFMLPEHKPERKFVKRWDDDKDEKNIA